ncbi:MAG: fatty acid desaturase family protein [Elainellaceae cyanobacterium]
MKDVSEKDFIRWKNILAIAYTLIEYAISLGLLIQPLWILKLVGVILLTHSFMWSAVLTHEFIHGTIFKARSLNAGFGRLMTHLNGACYAPYEDIVQHHFNHHIYHVDLVPFDSPTYFKRLPFPVRQLFVALEWVYFPVFEFVMRSRLILAPFQSSGRSSGRSHLRWRTLFLLTYRGALFGLLAWVSWSGLLLYGIAYICFVNLMRFADAFHHTYDYVVTGDPIPTRDRAYEDANTFSNLVSINHPWLNLLYLNFGYHNAHHHDMRCPWYALPALHQRLYGSQAKAIIPLPQLISNYHQFRIKRLFGGQSAAPADVHPPALADLVGGVGVSFLTPP